MLQFCSKEALHGPPTSSPEALDGPPTSSPEGLDGPPPSSPEALDGPPPSSQEAADGPGMATRLLRLRLMYMQEPLVLPHLCVCLRQVCHDYLLHMV